MKNLSSTTTLHNGVKMPWVGLGVWQAKSGEEVENAVRWAIEAGYKSFDNAAIYRNEDSVGKAIAASGTDRKELFLTSKVWNAEQGYESTLRAFESSLQKLQIDYLDLYLIHWPVKGKYLDTWKALEKIHAEGKAKAIGVSNFQVHHLKDILEVCEVKPMVNQVEFHLHLQQPELLEFCQWHNIQLEAWSPLMQGKFLEVTELAEVAQKYGKTPAQTLLRWALQKETVIIPKSVKQHRIEENSLLFDFEISKEDMGLLNQLNKNERIGPDPDNFDL